ncbi:MAG: signal recognition particle-docking protein FtsY [Verrucomicrobiae bacterium]|nr:signal recognition particle-docking protein FtsY [Verrucomicrobiae bacterium]
MGVATVTRIIEQVKSAAGSGGSVDVFAIARAEIERELGVAAPALIRAPTPPTVVLLAGVNGTGKTTSTAKLAYFLQGQGHSVLLAACDTFRAAAIEQLKLWAERVGCDLIAGAYGADAAALAFDAVGAAMARKVDYLLIDTAGRLHTKKNLMEEKKKIRRSVQKRLPAAPHEVLLVLDGTTGGNALHQAREFHEALGVTGLIVTKLDGTAKGGIVVAIARELKIPVKFVGLGEQPDDLQPFDPPRFAAALFGVGSLADASGGAAFGRERAI